MAAQAREETGALRPALRGKGRVARQSPGAVLKTCAVIGDVSLRGGCGRTAGGTSKQSEIVAFSRGIRCSAQYGLLHVGPGRPDGWKARR
jgi:hypothetical protein